MLERNSQIDELMQRQTRQLQEFDLHTATMGLDLAEIVDATQDSYQDEPGDAESVRGSVLSLTPSGSRNSFLPFSSAMPANSAL